MDYEEAEIVRKTLLDIQEKLLDIAVFFKNEDDKNLYYSYNELCRSNTQLYKLMKGIQKKTEFYIDGTCYFETDDVVFDGRWTTIEYYGMYMNVYEVVFEAEFDPDSDNIIECNTEKAFREILGDDYEKLVKFEIYR